jgi:electron transfer flavoprotein alpha subunit
MLKIAVCIKQIPQVEDANFDPVAKTLRRDGPAVISSFDLRAIALALDLKERHAAVTTVVTMGPPQARSALYEALAAGIDHAVHLEDRAFAGSDTLATARALALWLKPGRFDLVLTGKYSLDAETGQVGPEIAELLGIAQVTGLRKLRLEGRRLVAERESDEGFEEVECELPALLTCAERVAAPRRTTPQQREAAKAKPVAVVRAADLGTDPSLFGFAGSPTSVHEVRLLESPKVKCEFLEFANRQQLARRLVEALAARGALEPVAAPRRSINPALRSAQPAHDLWVACETDLRGAVTRATLELLSKGDELAAALGGALVAFGFAAELGRHAELLAAYGADRLLLLDGAGPASYSPDLVAAAAAELVAERRPWGLLLCASERGRDWGPRLAARLGLGLTGDAAGLELDGPDRLVALKPAFGGNIVAPIHSRSYPQMATVRPGVLEIARPAVSRRAAVEVASVAPHRALSRVLRAQAELDPSLTPLAAAQIVLGIGMGVGGPEGAARLAALAGRVKAGLAATRRVTDAGWIARQAQVGLTGKAIAPRLYIAFGIRGAPNHTVGIKRVGTVVAVNVDRDAPIFERADLGIVADWQETLPAVEQALLSAAAPSP